MDRKVKIKNFIIGNSAPLTIIAGPCVIESENLLEQVARELKRLQQTYGYQLILKCSYDKANRTSLRSFRGPGLKKGLEIIRRVKDKYQLPVLVDVHRDIDVAAVARVADAIQVPAFLCRQTDLLVAAGRTGKPVNVKKGQFLHPEAVRGIIEKIISTGNKNILLTERGTSFGYGDLVVDMRSIVMMKNTGYPVIFDATHSVQKPGSKSSGGTPEFIEPLARAAVSLGIAGIYLEVHPKPLRALSDGPNSLSLGLLKKFLLNITTLDNWVKRNFNHN